MGKDEASAARKIARAAVGGTAGAAAAAYALSQGAGPVEAAAAGGLTKGTVTETVDGALRRWEDRARRKELEENGEHIADALSVPLSRGVPEDEVVRDFASLLRAWEKASERSMGRKKRVLMAALQSSLKADPEEYDRGLGLAVLAVLEGLDYGDTLILKRVCEGAEDNLVDCYLPAEGLTYWHLDRLDAAGLLTHEPHAGAHRARPTRFGRRVFAYIRDGFGSDIAEEERETHGA